MENQPLPGDVVQPTQPTQPVQTPVQVPVAQQPVMQEVNTTTVQAAAGAAVAQLTPVAEAVATDAASAVLDDFKKTKFGAETVKFFDSSLGKSFQTLLWTVGAYVLTVGGARIANIHLDARLVALGVPGLLNWLLYTAKVFLDGRVQNFPGAKK
jgi:hypothetical protein